jgi:hypothetical protein
MDVVNSALENSPLAMLYESSDPVDAFSYGVENIPNHSRQRAEVVVSSPALSQDMSVEIPKYGILTKIIAKIDFTQATAAGATPAVGRTGAQGLNMLDYIELHSSNRVLSRMSQKGLAGMLSSMDSDKSTQVANAMNTSNAVATNKLAFIPFMYFLSSQWRGDAGKEEYRGCFDTRFVETLNVRMRLLPADSWEGDNGLTAGDLVLGVGTLNAVSFIFHYRVPSEPVYRSLEEKNYAGGVLNISNLTEFAESSKAITSGDTSETIALNSNGLVKKMFIQIEKASQLADNDTADRRVSHPITKLTLNGSGREIISFYGPEIQYLDDIKKSSTTINTYVLDFSAIPSASGYTGGLSLREIANPELVVEFADPSENATLTVVHLQHELLSINPANGRISVSLSS